MKKMLVVLALAMFSFANAQKGSVLVMGSIGYTSDTRTLGNNEVKNNEFEFSPKVGYQFHQNWTVGGEASFGSSKTKQGTNEERFNTTKLGAFLRYTMPLNQTFAFYAELGAGFQSEKDKTYTGPITTTAKGDGLYVGITPALFIDMNKGFGLNFNIGGLGYNTINYDNNGPEFKSFDFNFGKAFNIGVSKNF
ncbi:outer membrane beta-barrel protein [Flavobacterium sp. Fl-77]|uniref:Outer membrane beta-barrel protein n=1 Tax=Flavobacterium flavipigmentatum TaxID=2893884 RepID=A0AAJ2SF68_9FLAO|nr:MULTISPECIES: outer membrane beta-barrel protein [unclassified Flavobacterium]MDX6181401.1 outer membrane beta-barrel protein [Flavobacterium sp. Fl-33]MDX6185003.1 outer membrane beta-barrel protein [Flavobacterium sp. Fl-77]UFH40094.1 porin family protein [Flavobacterium sp. F-70]